MPVSKDVIMVVAKDLLIAAMSTGKVPVNSGPNPDHLSDIASNYQKLLVKIEEASKGMTG